MLKIYTEFAGRGICIFNIHHGAGFSNEKVLLCAMRHMHREAALLNDCELFYDEKVHTTNGLCRSGRL